MTALRQLDSSATDPWTRAAVLFIGVAVLLALCTYRHYGVTWDEEHSMTQGAKVISWYESRFTDRTVIEDSNFQWYGGLFNVVVQVTHRMTGLGLYETSHLLSVLVGLTGVALAFWIGLVLGGPLAGFLAAVFLWMTPVYYGHSFNNPKDIPFAVLSLASTAAIISCWKHLPHVPRAVWIRTGLVFGMTLAVRVAGILDLLYLALTWIAWLLTRAWLFDRSRLRPHAGAVVALVGAALKIAALAWIVMLLFWPYGAISPIVNPWRALLASAQFRDWIHLVRFNGADVMSDRLPWNYIPVWFAVTLPEFYFVAAGLGVATLWRVTTKTRTGAFDLGRVVLISLLIFTIVFPVATAMYSHSILYDGIRHLLFIVPPLAIVAGLAVAAFCRHVADWRVSAGAMALLGVSLISTGLDMWSLHPYQSVYFNRLIGGGLAGAANRFETDYWGQSYKEGVDWLVTTYRPDTSRVRVSNCSKEFLTGYYLDKTPEVRSRFVSVQPDEHPQVMLATTRWSCHQAIKGRVLHVVERMGTPLNYVIEVDASRRP